MSLTAPIVLTTDAPTTPTATMVIPMLVGAVTGTGSPVAVQVTGDALRDFFQGGVSDQFISTVAIATPSALSATQFTGFASTVSGAAIMGYGTTNDVALMNRAGTVVLGVGPNTTLVNIPAGLTVGTTLGVTGKITGTGTVTAAGAVADGTALTVTATAAANNDVLTGLKVSVAAGTPGSFTGLVRQGISVPAFTVVGDTSPGNPVGIAVGIITGTGASVASALSLAPPTGASTNYLIRHTTAATFSVTGVGSMQTAGFVLSSSPTLGIGYSTGAGGAQVQATNKQTTVVSNTITTAITMNNEQLNLLTITAFTFTNSCIAATDTVLCTHESAGTSAAYSVNAFPGVGSAVISVRNNTAGNLSEAIVLRVTVIKSVSA